MSYIGNKPTQGAITGGNIVDGSIESIDLATLTNIDINSGSIDGTIIGASSAAAGTFTSVDVTGTVSADGLTITAATPSIQMTDSDNNADSYIQATDGNLRFYADDGNEASNSIVTFSIDGSERARIDSSGNLGVGTSNPSWNISSYASLNSAIGSTASGGNGSAGFVSSIDNDTNVWFMGARKDSYGGSVGTERFNILRGTSNFLTVDTTGNVGIGTDSPSDKLHLFYNSATSSGVILDNSNPTVNGGTRVSFKYNGVETGYIRNFFNGGDFSTEIQANSDVRLKVGSSERMRIDSAGNVGIGTANPSCELNVSNSGDTEIRASESTSGTSLSIYQQANISYILAGKDSGTPTQPLVIYTGGSESARIDSSGNLLVGKTTSGIATSGVELTPNDRSAFTRSNGSPILANRTNSDGGIIDLRKDGASVGSIGTKGNRPFFASTSRGLIFVGSGAVPCTTAGEYEDNIQDLGRADGRFDDVYATNGTINTSDRNEKQDIEVLNEAEQRVAQACKGLLRKFRWKDSVEEKGDDARIHFGIIAQDLQDAFTAEGLDAGRYAMFISTTWTDEETGEERTRLGVRYSELLAFIISAL